MAVPNHQSFFASITQTGPGHYPILGTGPINYESIRLFNTGCLRIFQNKNVPADEQVSRMIYNFERPDVLAWVEANHQRFVAMTFPEFITEFKAKWLPRDWQDELVDKVNAP